MRPTATAVGIRASKRRKPPWQPQLPSAENKYLVLPAAEPDRKPATTYFKSNH